MQDNAPQIAFAPCSCGLGPEGLHRRRFLAGAAGLGVAGMLPACTSAPLAAGPAGDGLIDVHHHHIPPFYLEAYRDRIAGARGAAAASF